MADGRILQAGALEAVVARPASPEVAAMLGYEPLIEGEPRGGRIHADGVGTLELPAAEAEETTAGRVRVFAHPGSVLGVPPNRGLGCGVCGEVVASYPDGPLQILELRLGVAGAPSERHVSVRWEWDRAAPPAGSQIELAPRPGLVAPLPRRGAQLALDPFAALRCRGGASRRPCYSACYAATPKPAPCAPWRAASTSFRRDTAPRTPCRSSSTSPAR